MKVTQGATPVWLLAVATCLGCSSGGDGGDASTGTVGTNSSGAGASGGNAASGPTGPTGPSGSSSGSGGSASTGSQGPTSVNSSTATASGCGGSNATTTTGEGNTGGFATGDPTSTTASTTGGECSDQCPAPDGYVAYECKLRFMYGVNYAWNAFAGDFGGISAWGQAGVAGDSATVGQDLADMAANGVNVVRWWVWPDFRGDGVTFSGNAATGLGGTAEADLTRALELAEEHDLYLMLTLFSFDNFRSGNGPNLHDVVTSDADRAALVENAVRPFARVAAQSPYARRVIAWDVINEPEWAMEGSSPYGDEPYEADEELTPVSHGEMEAFVADVIDGLRMESGALVTVGGAAMKWARAWSNVDIDFYQFHIYDWVNDWWPYDGSPADYGVDDKPVVMGEFPVDGLSAVSYTDMLESWYENGYAGALGWAVTDGNFDWDSAKPAVRAFAESHACETAF